MCLVCFTIARKKEMITFKTVQTKGTKETLTSILRDGNLIGVIEPSYKKFVVKVIQKITPTGKIVWKALLQTNDDIKEAKKQVLSALA